jgi:hypothetical protein
MERAEKERQAREASSHLHYLTKLPTHTGREAWLESECEGALATYGIIPVNVHPSLVKKAGLSPALIIRATRFLVKASASKSGPVTNN